MSDAEYARGYTRGYNDGYAKGLKSSDDHVRADSTTSAASDGIVKDSERGDRTQKGVNRG